MPVAFPFRSSPSSRRLTTRSVRIARGIAIVLVCVGCDSTRAPDAQAERGPTEAAQAPTPTAPPLRVSDQPGAMTIADLRKQLGIGDAGQIRKIGGQVVAMDLRGTGVRDITALRGLQLRELYLEQNPISDIAPLAGMPLEKLYLDDTEVSDLSPLTGMTLDELNLSRTPIRDLGPLSDVELGTLWIPETQVSDLSPLAGKQFISLDVRGTPVSDLSPLAGNTSLRRLHIGETNVSDLTPLGELNLERLILTPARITMGWDGIRQMTSLRGLDTTFDGVSPVRSPDEFWQLHKSGDL